MEPVHQEVRRFWNSFALAMVAFARTFSARSGMQFECELEDFAQRAINATIRFLDRLPDVDCRTKPLTVDEQRRAFGYAKTCIKNAIFKECKRLRTKEKYLQRHSEAIDEDEGILQLSPRHSINPEQYAIATDFIRRVQTRVAAKRAFSMGQALTLIANEGSDHATGQDLTDLSGITSNALSYERIKLRVFAKAIGYSYWEINDEEG